MNEAALTPNDREHLRLLSIFHFVNTGLAGFGLLFTAFHYAMMSRVFANPAMWHGHPNPPPQGFFDMFIWLYVFMAVMMLVGGSLNLMVALRLRQRRSRMLCQIVSGLNCLQMPLGTLLGVFTLLVLGRDSVREAFDGMPAPSA
jgi:heme/copper-type cytochrome/quinol oxidase subunit 3